MKNLLKYLIVLIIIVFTNDVLFAQLNLVKRFEEMNKVGKSYFGRVVRSAGDVNGDGYDDIIVGAENYGNTSYHMGSAYLYYGGPQMDTIPDLIFRGEQVDDVFGCSVASAGDVNGDGYDDIIIGAYGPYRSSYYDGKAYLYFGGTAMDTVADVVFYGHTNNNSEYENGRFAISVGSAGDFNGDGYDDVLIGSQNYENDNISYDRTGGVHLFYGGPNMDATRDLLFVGENDGDKFGKSVASAGDINNDGYADIIVGAYGADKAYIYLGGANPNTTADLVLTDNDNSGYAMFGYSVSGAGDVNGDNYDDFIVGNSNKTSAYIYYGGSTLDATADVNLIYTVGGSFGISVSTAGDVNNDGYADVIVGDTFVYDNNNEGHAYIYLGSSTMDNVMDISFAQGDAQYSSFGVFVAYAGDINNDGYSDVVVGEDDDTYSPGSAYVYFGGQSMDNYTDAHLTGEGTGNTFGEDLDSGDFNGDGFPDIVVRAPSYYPTGKIYIYFGGVNADSIADVIIPYGGYMSSAGDINGDGYDDLIVANTHANNYTGEVYVYYGGNPMNTQLDFVYKGVFNYEYFGEALSGAGDLNGDGYDDIMIKGGQHVNIYFGGQTLSLIQDVQLKEASVDNFGSQLSNAGDVNGDGYDDIMVHGRNYGSNNLGRVMIYFGGASMDSIYDVGLSGQQGYDYFGYSLSDAGDVNGDGYDDIIIGAREYNNSAGRAYIYYGGSPMNTTPDVIFDAESPGDDFGDKVSGIGDINQDGYDDVIVGASTYYIDGNHTTMGKGYIYYGGSAMDTTPEYTFMDYSHYYGSSAPVYASAVGDFNGDGATNFIVSNYEHIANGMVFLYSDNNSALPVELTTFTSSVNDGTVTLNWQTATEVNNYGFEVERKQTNAEWNKIGFVEGNGNSNSPKHYVFTDISVPAGKYLYRLKQLDINGAFEYSNSIEVDLSAPVNYELSQNYPNPFNPTTVIKYSIPEDNFVTIKLYNILGKEVSTLVNDYKETGKYKVSIDGSKLSSGVYFYSIQAGDFREVKKMILQK